MVGVVGALQLDVLAERLQGRIRPAGSFETQPVRNLPLGAGEEKAELDQFVRAYPASMARTSTARRCFLPSRLLSFVTSRSVGRRR